MSKHAVTVPLNGMSTFLKAYLATWGSFPAYFNLESCQWQSSCW